MLPQGASTGTVLQIGPFPITYPVVTTWGIMAGLGVLSWLAVRRFGPQLRLLQVMVEGIIGVLDDAIRAVLPQEATRVFPFVATLWIFIVVANLIGLIPGVEALRVISP